MHERTVLITRLTIIFNFQEPSPLSPPEVQGVKRVTKLPKGLKRPRSPSPQPPPASFCTCHSRCTAKKSCPCKKRGQLCSSRCHPRHGCTNQSAEKGDLVELGKTTREKSSTPSKWCEVGGIQLTDKHRQTLQTSQWVDDQIIAASQNLLHQQHPGVGSLQPPTLAAQLAMEPQGGREIVQIVNMGHNHWITLSTVGCQPGNINVYDSLHMGLSSGVKELIADLQYFNGGGSI